MLTATVYPIIWLVLWGAFLVFLTFMVLRLVFNYADPNPFGAVGRFGFKIRKLTERFVYPAARLLATYNVDVRLGPLVTMFVGLALTYLTSQIIGNTFFIIDGASASITTGNVKALIGFILYALLSIFVLLLLIRFVSQWFLFTKNTLFGFAQKVTDPVLTPVRKLIPPVGMFDLSLLVTMVVISLLQAMVINIFVRQ